MNTDDGSDSMRPYQHSDSFAPAEKMAASHSDLGIVCRDITNRSSTEPEVAARVQQRANKVRAELAVMGTISVAVDLVREGRDEKF
jgi:hypothetical protein